MIWAQARGRVIGRGGSIPWHLPEDLAHFKATTDADPVIMGRASWFALPPRVRPLPGRRNVVLSRRPDFRPEGAEAAGSLEEALALVAGEDAWIGGGAEVYAQAMPRADILVVTDIDFDVDGDAFAPVIGPEWEVAEQDAGWRTSRTGPRFRVTTYRRAG